MVGSLDTLSSTPILTPNAVDSFTYLYFLRHWGETLINFFDGFGDCLKLLKFNEPFLSPFRHHLKILNAFSIHPSYSLTLSAIS